MTHVIAKQYAEALTAGAWLRDALLAFDVVAELSAALAPAWTVERELDPTGDLSIIVLPAGDDPLHPSFILYEESGLVQVATIMGEAWQNTRSFPTCRRAVAAIVATAVCPRPHGA